MNRIAFYKLLPEFKKKFLYGSKIKHFIQYLSKDTGKISYNFEGVDLTDQKLYYHFSQQPIIRGNRVNGSYGVAGRFENDILQWIAFDADNEQEFKDIFNKLIPKLNEYGIDHIVEYSQLGRCHLWVFCSSIPAYLIQAFAKQIVIESGASIKEVFPLGPIGEEVGGQNRENNQIRIIGGYHHRTKCANPISYRDEEDSNPLFIMKSVIDCVPITEDFIRNNLREITYQPVKKTYKEYSDRPFVFIPRNLKILGPEPPQLIKTIISNCQAYNFLIRKIVTEEAIRTTKEPTHDIGFTISGLSVFNDVMEETNEGVEWWTKLKEDYRNRSSDNHQWAEMNKAKYKEKPFMATRNCGTMEKTFPSICDGCPFKNRDNFHNPREFCDGKEVKKEKIREIKLVSNEDIKENTFPEAKKYIFDLLNRGEDE